MVALPLPRLRLDRDGDPWRRHARGGTRADPRGAGGGVGAGGEGGRAALGDRVQVAVLVGVLLHERDEVGRGPAPHDPRRGRVHADALDVLVWPVARSASVCTGVDGEGFVHHTAYMTFREATDRLFGRVGHQALADLLGVSVPLIRQARLHSTAKASRAAPAGWRRAVIRLAEDRVWHYRQLIDDLVEAGRREG